MKFLEKIKSITALSSKEDVIIGLSNEDYNNVSNEIAGMFSNSAGKTGAFTGLHEGVIESIQYTFEGKKIIFMKNKDILSGQKTLLETT